MIADKFYQKSVILAGDSAHSFPPAGGIEFILIFYFFGYIR
jgi:hypothetical protein